jgi:hypothetical protein
MRISCLSSLVGAVAVLGCGEIPPSNVIAGPAAPSRVVTEQPLVWDSREELLDWVSNGVTRGPFTVEGEGRAAFMRVKLDSGDYVMRGPDLEPAPWPVRGARLRARLRHDRPRPAQSVQTERVELYFEVVNPLIRNMQPSMYVSVPPSDEWQDLELRPGLYCCLQPLMVRYAYAPFRSTSPATLDIDRIELTR